MRPYGATEQLPHGKYKDAVVKYIVQAYGKDGLNKLIHEQQERNQNLSRDEAIDEIVADASIDRMGDKSFWQAVAENLGEDRAEVRGKIADILLTDATHAVRPCGATKR